MLFAFWIVYSTPGDTFDENVNQNLKILPVLKLSNIHYSLNLTSDHGGWSQIITEKGIAEAVNVTHDVTACRQIRPSIFMFK